MKIAHLLTGAALLAGLFTFGLFAQETAPPATTAAPTPTPQIVIAHPHPAVSKEEIETIKSISADEFTNQALKWIAAVGTVLTALLAALAALWSRFNELRSRVTQQNVRFGEQQAQITAVAMATTPGQGPPPQLHPPADPQAPPSTSSSSPGTAAICALLGLPFVLNGCAVTYDPKTGESIVAAQVTWADAIAVSQAIAAAKRGQDHKAIKLLERAQPPILPPRPAATPAPRRKPAPKATPTPDAAIA